MNYLIATLSLLLILACGRTLAHYFAGGLQNVASNQLYQHPAIGFALGLGFITVCNFLVSWVVPSWGLRITAGLALLLAVPQLSVTLAEAGVSIRNNKIPAFVGMTKRWLIPALLYGLIAIPATQTGLGHDNLAFWGYKASFIFLWGGWRSLGETAVWMPHPDYPLLVPTGQAWVYAAVGSIDEPASKLFFVACFVALLTLFHHITARLTSTRLAHLFTLLLLATPQLTSISALSGYADVPLMLFIVAGMGFVLLWQETKNSQHLLLAGILLGLAFWVKREGLVHFGVSFLFVTLLAIRTKQMKAMGWFLLGSVPFILLWSGYLRWFEIPNYDFLDPSLTVFWQNRARVWLILEALWGQVTAVGQWGFLWGIFFGVSLAHIYRRLPSKLRELNEFFVIKQKGIYQNSSPIYLWLMAVIPLLALSIAYVFSNWAGGLQTHLFVSLERLVLHGVPACWLFIASVSQPLDSWWQEMIDKNSL